MSTRSQIRLTPTPLTPPTPQHRRECSSQTLPTGDSHSAAEWTHNGKSFCEVSDVLLNLEHIIDVRGGQACVRKAHGITTPSLPALRPSSISNAATRASCRPSPPGWRFLPAALTVPNGPAPPQSMSRSPRSSAGFPQRLGMLRVRAPPRAEPRDQEVRFHSVVSTAHSIAPGHGPVLMPDGIPLHTVDFSFPVPRERASPLHSAGASAGAMKVGCCLCL